MAMLSSFILQLFINFILLNSLINPVAPVLNNNICPSSDNNTMTSSFQSDLRQLLSSLPQNALNNGGFFKNIVGEAYGLAMCHYNVPINQSNCGSCLREATESAIQMCPNSPTAALFYDQCFIRYSNQNFFTVASTDFYQLASVRKESEQFITVVEKLMDKLITDVVSTPELAIEGNVNYRVVDKVYGLVECTRDLTAPMCQMCLRVGFKEIRYGCNAAIGCRLYGLSCYLQYEVTALYDPFPPPPPPSLPPLPTLSSLHARSATTGKKKLVTIFIAVGCAIAVLLVITGVYLCIRRKRRTVAVVRGSEALMKFDLKTLQDATNNFSDENKLGVGGFGPVFKGTLQNGQEIAVKRLASNSKQGIPELENEVKTLGVLKHRNVVQILGFCMEDNEKILCYEYLPKRSLDMILFENDRRAELDWMTRFNIIKGICRGLGYLHIESGAAIIHRDLKPGNILLDENMNPKISDFGTARLFDEDQTHKTTTNAIGTMGYWAPEYVNDKIFSTRSDVFSFGILVLVIVTGIKCPLGERLVDHVWKHWERKEVLKLIKDAGLPDTCLNEATKCIHIGMLCVKQNPKGRPDISVVYDSLVSRSPTILSRPLEDPRD